MGVEPAKLPPAGSPEEPWGQSALSEAGMGDSSSSLAWYYVFEPPAGPRSDFPGPAEFSSFPRDLSAWVWLLCQGPDSFISTYNSMLASMCWETLWGYLLKSV